MNSILRKGCKLLIISLMLVVPSVVLAVNINIAKEIITSKTYNFTYNDPQILNDKLYTTLTLQTCLLTAQTGYPKLPFSTITLLTENKQISSIDIIPHFSKEYILATPLEPQQKYYPLSKKPEEGDFSYNKTGYNQDKYTFNQLYEIQPLEYCRGYPLQTITLYPINYNPAQNKILFYDSFTITINYKNQPLPKHSLYRNLETDKQEIKTLVDNPQDLEKGGYHSFDYEPTDYASGICDPTGHYEYVIITNETLNDTTGQDYNWSDLMNFRTYFNGFSCFKIALNDIMNCSAYWNATATFNDSAARVREFCKDAYQDWETEYILLGGEWHSGDVTYQMVPDRVFHDTWETDIYDTMSCDLYFSNLDGTWYTGANWGGGKGGTNDKTSELYVGRICAYNATMVSNAVNKTIWYENTTHDIGWLNNCTFAGDDLGWTSTSKQYMEAVRIGNDYFSENIGFEEWNGNHTNYPLNTSNRWYDADGKWNDFPISIENDNASIINQMGHGSYTTPFSLPNWLFRLHNKSFFGYSQACLGGRFNGNYAGCEQLICRHSERHAFALEINTGYGYGSSGSTDGPNQEQQKMFWDYFFNSTNISMDEWQLGKAHTYSKNKIGQMIDSEDRVWTYAFYSTNLFGDPAITLQFAPLSENQVIILSLENGTNMTNIFTPNPTINWTIIGNTFCYWLQISNNSVFTDLVVNITDVSLALYPLYYTENTTVVSFILPTTYSLPSVYKTYYIRVKANVKGGFR